VYAAGAPDTLQVSSRGRGDRSDHRGREERCRGAAGGNRVAHLVGTLGEAASRGKHAWVGLDDHSLAAREAPGLLADVYAAAGAPWVENGYLTHIVEVPAEGSLPQLFFALGFGQEQVHASARVRVEEPSTPEGAAIRRAGPTDIELLLDVVGAIGEHQVGPPVWSGLPMPEREGLRADWVEFLEDETAVILVAEREGSALGYVAFYPGEGRAVAHLPVAGTRPDVRGTGIGVALVEHALHQAHRAGFDTVQLDWRSTNLLASRFWPKRGFTPTHLRLRRDIQPTA
jgi:ribosomal protein S18 acetylase RimI-like enzyme